MSENPALIVQKLVDTGWHLSIDTSDLYKLILKLTVLSLKYIDKKAIWDYLFPANDSNHVDWTMLKSNFNALDELYFWLPVLEKMTWKDMDKIADKTLPLAQMKGSLRKAGLDTGDYDLACRLLILHLLQGVPVLQAFEMLTCRFFKRGTHQPSAILLANLSDVLHTPTEYEECLKVLLHPSHCCIEVTTLQEQLDVLESVKSTTRALSKTHLRESMASGRPRLRDLIQHSHEEKVQMDNKHGTWETYTGFCQLHQFPNILNDVTKQKAYFMAAQDKWDWQKHVHLVLGHKGDLSERVASYPVTKPDVDTLHSCIQRLNMNGRPPFAELLQFKNKCFVNFPITQYQNMNLTQFLRLFACIYQNEQTWKDLWRMQGVLFSPQLIKDCGQFVASVAFPEDEFMAFLLN
jgi:hypothetical protein